MNKTRLEAFSDGLIAIVITVMVLEMHAPDGTTLASLKPLFPSLISYILSFIYVGIYWNNHHHLMHVVERVNGHILWANLHLLFWISLIPFVTAWNGRNNFATVPIALYGCVLMMAGIAYYILVQELLRHHGPNSALARAIGKDFKGRISIGIYAAGILLAFVNRWIAFSLYCGVALIWLVPDSRIEKTLES
jgi:uncharacterized membrane protein